MNPNQLDKAIDEIILEMQTRISDAWQAWDGAEAYDADEMFEKYGDETDAAERNAHAQLTALLVEARIEQIKRIQRGANVLDKAGIMAFLELELNSQIKDGEE